MNIVYRYWAEHVKQDLISLGAGLNYMSRHHAPSIKALNQKVRSSLLQSGAAVSSRIVASGDKLLAVVSSEYARASYRMEIMPNYVAITLINLEEWKHASSEKDSIFQ